MATYLLLGGSILAILAYNKSTSSIEKFAKESAAKPRPLLIENSQHYGGGSDVNRFNNKTKYIIDTYIGQFGLPEQVRYDSGGSVTRTWDIGLENF